MKPDILVLAFLSCFFLGRETSNVDIAALLRTLNETKDAASKALSSIMMKTSASELIDNVRKQVIEDHDTAGDAEVGALDLSSLEVLGSGSFGTVYKGSWRGAPVAIKSMILMEKDATERHEHLAIMEAIISSTLSHPNIVQTYRYSLSPIPSTNPSTSNRASGMEMRLVMEYCELGSLRQAIDSGFFHEASGELRFKAILETAADVARAMVHLSECNILHNDLKASNVLLRSSDNDDRGFSAKCNDFGFSLSVGKLSESVDFGYKFGTITHLAPETIKDGIKSKQTDIYAFGILLHELTAQGKTFPDANKAFLHNAIVLGIRPKFAENINSRYKELADSCWHSDPSLRPSFKSILETLVSLRNKEEEKASSILKLTGSASRLGKNRSRPSSLPDVDPIFKKNDSGEVRGTIRSPRRPATVEESDLGPPAHMLTLPEWVVAAPVDESFLGQVSGEKGEGMLERMCYSLNRVMQCHRWILTSCRMWKG